MPNPLTWWELDRTDYAVVRLAQPWLAHDGHLWAMIEIENLGDVVLGIVSDDDDKLRLAFSNTVLGGKQRIRDELALAKIARIRFEEGTIPVRLGPGQRWRLHGEPLELDRVQRGLDLRARDERRHRHRQPRAPGTRRELATAPRR